jgi:hypothetical protein
MLKMLKSLMKTASETREAGVFMETPTETALLRATQAGADGFRYVSGFQKPPSLSSLST